MRNQSALVAACAAAAVLGFAAPVAVADGTGNGGHLSSHRNLDNHGSADNRGNNNRSNFSRHGNFDDNGEQGSEAGRTEDSGPGEDNGNDGRGSDSGRADDTSRGDDSGGSDDNSADHGDGGLRNIVSTPGVLPAGGRLAVSVDGCHGGTMSSRAFPTTDFNDFNDDTARGTTEIDRDAPPGRYDVTIHCDGRTLVRPAAFTVLGGVQGGVGGSRSTGATPADMAIGAGLVTLAVVGGGAFWLRRRHEKRT
ncbi:hypothetical protein ACFV2N_03155 [Streptomyces sp. NPDC059680]|uniref:hypothetical protein n=1 Tax=Streptomyces sp. NPDC059680 TaxID=3346904 RepID=UPI0036D0FE0E